VILKDDRDSTSWEKFGCRVYRATERPKCGRVERTVQSIIDTHVVAVKHDEGGILIGQPSHGGQRHETGYTDSLSLLPRDD
jgi:hypothetical protein